MQTRCGAHLDVLQSQVLPVAPSVNRKPRARTRHQAEEAHEGLDHRVDAEADVVKLGAEVVAAANGLKAGASFTLSEETRELEGGMVLKRGDVEVNCAFATQLRLLRQTMAADVAAILFS